MVLSPLDAPLGLAFLIRYRWAFSSKRSCGSKSRNIPNICLNVGSRQLCTKSRFVLLMTHRNTFTFVLNISIKKLIVEANSYEQCCPVTAKGQARVII